MKRAMIAIFLFGAALFGAANLASAHPGHGGAPGHSHGHSPFHHHRRSHLMFYNSRYRSPIYFNRRRALMRERQHRNHCGGMRTRTGYGYRVGY